MKSINRILIAGLLIVTACTNDDPIEEVATDPIVEAQQEADVVFMSAPSFGRMETINRTIVMEETGQGIQSGSNQNRNPEDYYWTWVAKVDSPIVSGQRLSATHSNINGNRAFVSYNKQGPEHLGALEVLNINDPAAPSLEFEVQFLNADINALTVENSNVVWLAASHKDHGATVYRINVNTQQVERINLSNSLPNGISASANGISITNSYIVVSAGKTYGGLFFIDKSNRTVVDFESYSDCKYVDVVGNNDNTVFASLVTGDVATVKTGRVNDFGSNATFATGPIVHTNVDEAYRGKNTLHFDPYNNDRVYVSLAQEGLKAFNLNSGAITNQSSGTMLLEGNTNAVALDEDYMYIANGADGIAIGTHVIDGQEINPMFVWDLAEQPASANYVTAQNDWIFVCKGLGGFNILYKQLRAPYVTVSPYNENGTPVVMEPDEVVCETLLPTLFEEVLPERQNALVAHPEYFENPAKTIHLTEEAEVKITFLNEGAGYKNVLGYYTYEAGNPPQSVEDLDKIVIFPNSSAQGSGGELIRGNTIRLLGTFPADTMVGFFLIADGWRNQTITEGHYTQYTDLILNDGRQQTLIFHENECNATVISFEDISVPNGDKDFNDAIFQIHADPPTAIDTTEYIQIN